MRVASCGGGVGAGGGGRFVCEGAVKREVLHSVALCRSWWRVAGAMSWKGRVRGGVNEVKWVWVHSVGLCDIWRVAAGGRGLCGVWERAHGGLRTRGSRCARRGVAAQHLAGLGWKGVGNSFISCKSRCASGWVWRNTLGGGGDASAEGVGCAWEGSAGREDSEGRECRLRRGRQNRCHVDAEWVGFELDWEAPRAEVSGVRWRFWLRACFSGRGELCET